MKMFIFSIVIALSIFTRVHAEDLVSVDTVAKQGLTVLMGELTGAGSRFSLKNLHGLVLPEGVLLKKDITGIVVKQSADPKVSDIVTINVQNAVIPAQEFVGFVVK